jgi:hypothetical protein
VVGETLARQARSPLFSHMTSAYKSYFDDRTTSNFQELGTFFKGTSDRTNLESYSMPRCNIEKTSHLLKLSMRRSGALAARPVRMTVQPAVIRCRHVDGLIWRCFHRASAGHTVCGAGRDADVRERTCFRSQSLSSCLPCPLSRPHGVYRHRPVSVFLLKSLVQLFVG